MLFVPGDRADNIVVAIPLTTFAVIIIGLLERTDIRNPSMYSDSWIPEPVILKACVIEVLNCVSARLVTCV